MREGENGSVISLDRKVSMRLIAGDRWTLAAIAHGFQHRSVNRFSQSTRTAVDGAAEVRPKNEDGFAILNMDRPVLTLESKGECDHIDSFVKLGYSELSPVISPSRRTETRTLVSPSMRVFGF